MGTVTAGICDDRLLSRIIRALSVWNASKKKSLFSVPAAHGSMNWITALAAVPFSDLIASGRRMLASAHAAFCIDFNSRLIRWRR